MSRPVSSVKFDVEATKFYRYIDDLDARTNLKTLRAILRNTGTKVYVPKLRAHATGYAKYQYTDKRGRVRAYPSTGNLRRSMGNITGKDRRVATVFVGPRMARGADRDSGAFKGWVVNILENWKDPTKRRTRFKAVHLSQVRRAEKDIHRAVEWIVKKRWK
jgi:hypothetical protein